MTQLEIRAVTLEQEMQVWGENYHAAQRNLNGRAREAYQLFLRWTASGQTGDYAATLAKVAGISRTTAWRAWRAGYALHLGAPDTADQGDLVDAARALDHGATAEEVVDAINTHGIRDLAQRLDVGSVGRRFSAEAAELREEAQRRLSELGMQHVTPSERDELVYRAFLVMPKDDLVRLIQAYRALTEGGQEE